MLTFENKGTPIAIVNGGKDDNKILNLVKKQDKCCENCIGHCDNFNKCCEGCKGGECGGQMINPDPVDSIDVDYLRQQKKNIKPRQWEELIRALQRRQEPDNPLLRDLYNKSQMRTRENSITEYSISGFGKLVPVPDMNLGDFMVYLAGPNGAGKSYVIKLFLEQMRKVHPNLKIHLFTDVDAIDDPELKDFPGLLRIPLDNRLNKPFKTRDFLNSCVIFDDIDSCQDKKVRQNLEGFRDNLLKIGRKMRISCMVTNHMINTGKNTTTVMNECKYITLFPKAGNKYAINYCLKSYIGLDRKQINKIYDLPSRWVLVHKAYPYYVISEYSAYIL
jgi:hypothetical protein